MFNTTEYPFVTDLVKSMYNQGYKNYVCYTNRVALYGINNYNLYDIFCRFSKNAITNNNYQFSFAGSDNILFSIDSTAYSNNNTIAKQSKSTFSATSITIDSREYILSNVGTYPNVIADYELQTKQYDEYMDTSLNNHLNLTDYYLIPATILLIVAINLIKSIFRKR